MVGINHSKAERGGQGPCFVWVQIIVRKKKMGRGPDHVWDESK